MISLSELENPGILHPSTRLYYRKFLVKAIIQINGGTLLHHLRNRINQSFVKFNTAVDKRKRDASAFLLDFDKSTVPKQQWSQYDRIVLYTKSDAASDAKHLFAVHTALLKHKIKYRIFLEEVALYAANEETLVGFLNDIDLDTVNISYIERPETATQQAKLECGVLFFKKEPKHKWKIQIKPRVYSIDEKNQFTSYVLNQGGNIVIPARLTHQLTYRHYIQGAYYANDESVLLFLKMILPDFVSKIFKLEKIPG